MIFSNRTQWNLEENDFAAAVRLQRAAGGLLDLTVANPTACGFTYPDFLLVPLASPAAALYIPEPFGMLPAREAVVGYYRDHAATVAPGHICLTTSTSEAYSFLFRLLCNPGDTVLIAQPSYPLFDFIAQLDDVRLRPFSLFHDPNTAPADVTAAWSIDLAGLSAAITSTTRAILLVHPNNPTGNYIAASERIALQQLCVERDLALVVDEVFLDYSLPVSNGLESASHAAGSFAAEPSPCLTFVLSGVSKICGLPQMKASWIVAAGPAPLVGEALARLEVIADTFLSINAPIQFALPQWLADRHPLQLQIRNRMFDNLAVLDERLRGLQTRRLAMQAGWTTILHVPRTEDFALTALARGVLVQPGESYGLPPGRAVLSLLTPPDLWREGLRLLPLA